MTALAADNNAVQTKGKNLDLKSYLVADNIKIYKNAVVVIDASGYLRPARNTAGELVAGIAFEQVDNTVSGHTAGGKSCRVQSNGHFLLLCAATATQAYVGQPIYALDDQTVTATAGTPAGKVTEYVDSTHVWVYVETLKGDTASGLTATSGDIKITAGNLRLGAISAFATTEPTSWAVFKAGTQPSGAITTSGGIGANATTMQKIIAAGTINNIET